MQRRRVVQTIWASPVDGKGGIRELDLDGIDRGTPPGMGDRGDWNAAVLSSDRRLVAFGTDGGAEDFVYDRDSHEIREIGPIDGCFTLDVDGEVVTEPPGSDPLDQRCPVRPHDGSILWIDQVAWDSPANDFRIRFRRTTPSGGERKLGEISGCNAASWAASPVSDEIAFSTHCVDGGAGIDVINLANMKRRRVARGEASTVPSWSPDGSQILFARSTDGSPENFRLFVVDADGSGERKISDRPYLWPIWID